MNKIPHVLVVALSAAAPVFFAAMANHPLTWQTFLEAASMAGLTLIGVLLKSPVKS